MSLAYSIYDAKAHFSELVRHTKGGKRVIITERGKKVAELIPYREADDSDLEARIARLRAEGIVSTPTQPPSAIKPIATRKGALKRFLESRE